MYCRPFVASNFLLAVDFQNCKQLARRKLVLEYRYMLILCGNCYLYVFQWEDYADILLKYSLNANMFHI